MGEKCDKPIPLGRAMALILLCIGFSEPVRFLVC